MFYARHAKYVGDYITGTAVPENFGIHRWYTKLERLHPEHMGKVGKIACNLILTFFHATPNDSY